MNGHEEKHDTNTNTPTVFVCPGCGEQKNNSSNKKRSINKSAVAAAACIDRGFVKSFGFQYPIISCRSCACLSDRVVQMVRWAYPSYTAFIVNGRGSIAVYATAVISSNNKTLRAVLNDLIKGSINDMRVEIFDQVSGFAVGSVVYVERRMGPNENKPGGMARWFCVYFDYLVPLQLTRFCCGPRITAMRLSRDRTHSIYDVNYILDSTRETDLPGDLLSQQSDTKSRRSSSLSSAKERSIKELEKKFKEQEDEYKSRIAVANWQVFFACE